jgi:sec-independent protein translocase protein TatB
MFDFDSGKLLIIGIIALIVIGPKELPGVMRQVGQAVARLRRMAAEFQGQFMEAMREAEIEDLKKDVTRMVSGDELGHLDPLKEIRGEVESTRAQIESAFKVPVTEPSPPAAAGETPDAAPPHETAVNGVEIVPIESARPPQPAPEPLPAAKPGDAA